MTSLFSRPLSRRAVLVAMAASLAAPLAGCARGADAAPLRLAAGEAGALYFQFGELLRDALKRRSGLELEVLATNASVENLAMLADGSASLAIALADSAIDAYERGASLVALGRVYQNYLQCVVRAESEIGAVADLRGRAVSIGAGGSGSALTTLRLFAANGLADGDNPPLVREYRLEEAANALESGEIDAFFWSGGVPTERIRDLHSSTSIRLLDLSGEFAALNRAHPHTYSLAEVPPGVYGAVEPTTTIGIANFLLARPDLPDSVAEAIVDVLVGDSAALVPAGTAGVQYLTLGALIDTAPIPLHEGAARRYRQRYG